jgi:hypothetical protein
MPLAEAEELIRMRHDGLSQTRAVEASGIEGAVLQELACKLESIRYGCRPVYVSCHVRDNDGPNGAGCVFRWQ